MLLLLPWLSAPVQAQQQAQAAPVVIWVEATLPEEKLVRKVARLSGGEPQHYTGANLAFLKPILHPSWPRPAPRASQQTSRTPKP